MPKWIKPARVRAAISGLFEWRGRAKSQAAMHLWPLLALIEKGVNPKGRVKFTEQDDRAFWNRYGRLSGETRQPTGSAPFTQDYYVEPLHQQLKPSDYPHRGPSSIRDRTFLNAWRAAQFEPATEEWTLSPDYAAIFEEKVLSRGGLSQRVPVVDLAAFLFRSEEFDEDADAAALQSRFQERFSLDTPHYERLFVFNDEPAENIYTDTRPTDEAMNEAIRDAMVASGPAAPAPSPPESEPSIDENDRHLIEVRRLLKLASSGIIFRGPPGTSKTWYAKQIARQLVADPEKDIFQVQFHPSYGYEDFVEGYRPNENTRSGFTIVDRVFLDARKRAEGTKPTAVIFIIDEINRGDPARAFGELLTYIEQGYRGVKFPTALSGQEISVPPNLIVFGTMNPHDRSTTQFDVALVRRFDHIDLTPDVEFVESFLTNVEERPTDFTSEQVSRIAKWFTDLQDMLKQWGGVGHTYFKDVRTVEDLRAVWKYRMLPYCSTVLELESTRLAHVVNSFEAMMADLVAQVPESGE
jgi:5-methylcytosine-specific restriction enzyme B